MNLRTGRVEEATVGGLSYRLAEAHAGRGAVVALPGRGPPAALLAPPDRARAAPWPDGFDAQGPEGWTLAEAWAVAQARSSELAEFLDRHPDAFAVEMENETLRASLVESLVATRKETWSIRLLATDGSALLVEATRDWVQGVATESVRVAADAAPAEAPTRFEPPERRVADLHRLLAQARETGLAPDARLQDAALAVRWEKEDADFLYLVQAAEGAQLAGGLGSVATSFLTMNADTGRLTDAEVPRERAREILARYAEASG